MEKLNREIHDKKVEYFKMTFPDGEEFFLEEHYGKDNLLEEFFIKDKEGKVWEFADIKADENLYKRVKEIFKERGIILKDDELKKITPRYVDESQRNALEEINNQKDKEN